MRLTYVFVFLLGLFIVQPLQAGGTLASLSSGECHSYSSDRLNQTLRYCVFRSRPDLEPVSGEPALFFFHGIGGGAASWTENGYQEAMEILSVEESFPPFTVVSFDTNSTSFFADANGLSEGAGAYESWFVKDFVPFVTQKFDLCSTKECRGVAGVSMGGLGALKTALRHSGLFSFAAANSPALVPFNAWKSDADWNSYFSRHEVGIFRGRVLLERARRVFQSWDQSNWNDPTWLIENFGDLNSIPALYFDVGGRDYFGFQEGFFRFKQSLEARGITYASYYEPNGGHELFWDRRWWLLRFVRERFEQ